MVLMNKLLMVMVFSVAVIALTGAASAAGIGLPTVTPMPGLTVTADTVQTNGHYIGVPKLISGETYTYGYNYTLVPDGTYTVTGTVKNNNDKDVIVEVILFNKTLLGEDSMAAASSIPWAIFNVSAKSKASYSITLDQHFLPFQVNSSHDIGGLYESAYLADFDAEEPELYFGYVDFGNANYVDAPQSSHTWDEGPMSGMSVLLNNGALKSNATVIYSINVTTDDYKALYTSGKMDFQGSPLYAFAE